MIELGKRHALSYPAQVAVLENVFDGGFELVRALYEELRARRDSADLNLA